jgi:hypothetical protein
MRNPPLPPAIWHTTTAEGAAFVESMPMTVDQAIDVFELTFNLLAQEESSSNADACNGDFRRVEQICKSNGADFEAVASWLRTFGVTCDCNVYNVDKLFEEHVELDDNAWEEQVEKEIDEGRLPADYRRFTLSK